MTSVSAGEPVLRLSKGRMMMIDEKQSDGGNGLLMFMLGLAGGAAVALLYAPLTGSDTRRYIRDRAQQARDQAGVAAGKARDMMQQAKQNAAATVDGWRPTLVNAIDQGRQAVEEGKETFNYAVEQGREAYQEAKTASRP
jgi:gas vesicle protein